jgi:hypothetical protein
MHYLVPHIGLHHIPNGGHVDQNSNHQKSCASVQFLNGTSLKSASEQKETENHWGEDFDKPQIF